MTLGALHASGVDRVDLYRFTVTKRSLLKLAVSGTSADLTLRLRNDRGHLVDSAQGGDIKLFDGSSGVLYRLCGLGPKCAIASGKAPALVSAHHIVELDLDGQEIRGTPQPLYLERFIHAEIYRVRPDVGAVVHSHSPSVLPFSVVPFTTFSTRFGSPAAAAKVGIKSSCAPMSLTIVPG